MQYSTDIDSNFKEPLSRTVSRLGSIHSLSQLSTYQASQTPLWTLGSKGVLVSTANFIIDAVTDGLLLAALWQEITVKKWFDPRVSEAKSIFLVTACIIGVPLIIVNICSLIWYTQKSSYGESAFGKKTKFKKFICVMSHFILLGPIVRYIDVLHDRNTVRNYYKMKYRDRLRPSLSVEEVVEDIDFCSTFARDTITLDLARAFLQSTPQIVYQIILIYKFSSKRSLLLWMQILKIFHAIWSTSWSTVCYDDALRRGTTPSGLYRPALTCGIACVCVAWRASMLSARTIAIASLAALTVDGEGGLIKTSLRKDSVQFSFGWAAAGVVIAHWLIMIIWIYSQVSNLSHSFSQTTSLCTQASTSTGYFTSFVSSIFLGWVHVFSYLNLKPTPSRRRITLFYLLMTIENTAFIVIWYLQMIKEPVWVRITVVFWVNALFYMGVSCAVGYYGFVRPTDRVVDQTVSQFSSINRLESRI